MKRISLLDVACGAGRFTRRMAELGGRIVAIDHSTTFLERPEPTHREIAKNSGVTRVPSRLCGSLRPTKFAASLLYAAIVSKRVNESATLDISQGRR